MAALLSLLINKHGQKSLELIQVFLLKYSKKQKRQK